MKPARRPATIDDLDFICRLDRAAFREYIDLTWGRDETRHAERFHALTDPPARALRSADDELLLLVPSEEDRVRRHREMSASIVLFDFGDVIAAFDPSFRAAELARHTGLSPDEVLDRLSTDDFWADTDRGVWSGSGMERRINELLGHDFAHDELLRLQAAAFTVRSEMLQIAGAVSETRRTGILTNNAPLLLEAFPVHFPEVTRIFDPLLFSFQFGHVKPEPELYEAVGKRLGVAPADILFIDDNPRNVAAARSSGWDAVTFRTARRLREALVERGILSP